MFYLGLFPASLTPKTHPLGYLLGEDFDILGLTPNITIS